jgi:hypothetical protein
MKTAFIVKAHVNRNGRVISDEPVPLPPGEVDITVQATAALPQRKLRTKRQIAKLTRCVRRIQNTKAPSLKKDNRSIDEIVYGFTRKRG